MEYKILTTEPLYKGFFSLTKYRFTNELFKGGWSDEFTREVLERGNASAVLLFDPNWKQLVLVEQFRAGAIGTDSSPWLMELVAGMIELGESPAEVVCREAVEEAGASIGRLQKICDYWVSPGGTSERVWLFLGEIDSHKILDFGGLDSENEDIKVHCISVEKAFNWLDEGRINNAMSIIALQWLRLKLLRKSTLWR
ncbi:MAG: NUDIX domain-containing protein [Kangiellaceae bacterium]|nr:NUDIX domain-containing protein [Kangiellaceae bacterium]